MLEFLLALYNRLNAIVHYNHAWLDDQIEKSNIRYTIENYGRGKYAWLEITGRDNSIEIQFATNNSDLQPAFEAYMNIPANQQLGQGITLLIRRGRRNQEWTRIYTNVNYQNLNQAELKENIINIVNAFHAKFKYGIR